MPNALQHVAWEPCLIEPSRDRALESYARRRQGIPNPAIGYFASVPWLARALVDLHSEYGLLIRLDQDVADLVVLGVSQENSCRFCYAGVRALLWAQGMSRARIRHVEQELTRADLPLRTVAAIAFGRSQSRSDPPGAHAARDALLRAGFGADEMKEIAFAVGSTDFSNRAHTIPAIPSRPIERIPDQLHMRLFRPLIHRILRSRRHRGRATPLDRVPSHPYARLVQAYAGSPIAPALGLTLDEMWASPHLTRRCKLLMLAVVARGLSCEVCALEVGEALQREGLTETVLAQVLTHLDAPEMDPVERLLVPFARETIWYELVRAGPGAAPRPGPARPPHWPAAPRRDRRGGPGQRAPRWTPENRRFWVSTEDGLCRMGAMVLDCP